MPLSPVSTRTLVDALFEGPLVGRCLVAPDGTILRANAEWLRSTGLTPEVVGGDIVALFPETRATTVALHARARAGERVEVPRHVQRVNGRATWWEGRIEPIAMDDGTGLLITSRVVDEPQQLEALHRLHAASVQLIEADDVQALYERILDAATAIMRAELASFQVLDPERGELVLLGHRGFSPHAARFWQRVRPGSHSSCAKALRFGRRVVVPDVAACEWMAGSEDQEVLLQTGIRAVQTTPLVERSGAIIGMISTHWRRPHEATRAELRMLDVLARQAADLIDRTRKEEALREANERLRQADHRKDEFLGMLSHELRNPLAPIRNSLFILDRSEPTGPQARRARDVISRQVGHLTRIVDDLLDVTRIARGKVELRRTDLDLAALARRTAEDYRALMEDRGLEFAVDVSDDPIEVNGDEVRLAQVLGNLLSNAAKFTLAGGRVTLAVHARGDRAVLRVGDTGPGIAPEVLPTLFEPFTQARQTLARSEGGLGLGLALVKALVALHGGDVGVASPGSEGGTEFLVGLPLTAHDGSALATAGGQS